MSEAEDIISFASSGESKFKAPLLSSGTINSATTGDFSRSDTHMLCYFFQLVLVYLLHAIRGKIRCPVNCRALSSSDLSCSAFDAYQYYKLMIFRSTSKVKGSLTVTLRTFFSSP